MLNNLRKILGLFSSEEKPRLLGLLLLAIAVATLEVIGVASIMPFMGVLANQELALRTPLLRAVFDVLGFSDSRHFLIFLGIVALTLIVFSNFLNALLAWLMIRFAYFKGHALSERLLSQYVRQPYEFFFSRNATELGKNILAEVDRVVTGVLLPLFQVTAKSVVTLLLLLVLFAAEPQVALATVGVLGGCYLAIYFFMRTWLQRTAQGSFESSSARFLTVSETLSGIKELRLLDQEMNMVTRYSRASLAFARHQSNHQVTGTLPRFVLETLAFGGLIFIILYMLQQGRELASILPTLSLYGLAGYRLIPALQHIFGGLTSLGHHLPGVDLLYADLIESAAAGTKTDLPRADRVVAPTLKIGLTDIEFTYPTRELPSLTGVSLHIPVGSSVAFVGRSGAGKTTAAEVLLGLLRPARGGILVDGHLLAEEDIRSWQKLVGYVPQGIFLIDDTVAANIALGLDASQVDMSEIERAARQANIHDFIVGSLPNGYATSVGDRGVKLSGGQRQRIGIARALYRDPPILVLDEGTSALDYETEQAIMETIRQLAGRKTVVMIAHRLQTIRECELVYLFENGRARESNREAVLGTGFGEVVES